MLELIHFCLLTRTIPRFKDELARLIAWQRISSELVNRSVPHSSEDIKLQVARRVVKAKQAIECIVYRILRSFRRSRYGKGATKELLSVCAVDTFKRPVERLHLTHFAAVSWLVFMPTKFPGHPSLCHVGEGLAPSRTGAHEGLPYTGTVTTRNRCITAARLPRIPLATIYDVHST